MTDPWDVLAKVYGVESGAPPVGAAVADRIGVQGVVNRTEVEHMVSALVGNRLVEDALSGRNIAKDPIVQWMREGHARGVLLVPEESLGPSEPRRDPEALTDLVIEELKRAFTESSSRSE
jgi:hypothetical protein